MKSDNSTVLVNFGSSFNDKEKVKITLLKNKVVDFSNAYNEVLSVLIIPEGIKEIGISSFENCTNLQRVSLPETMNKLGRRCFYNCKSLNTIYIPKNLYLIEEEAFNNCKSLSVLAFNNYYFSIENRFNNTNISTVINDQNIVYLRSELFKIVNDNCNFLINRLLVNDVYNYIKTNKNVVVINSSIVIYLDYHIPHSIMCIEKGKILYKKKINFNLYE